MRRSSTRSPVDPFLGEHRRWSGVGVALFLSLDVVLLGAGDANARQLPTPNPGIAWVTNQDTYTVTPVDLTDGVAGEPILVQQVPSSVAAAPDGRTIYVAGSAGVVPIDVERREAGALMRFPGCLRIAVTPDGHRAYVANYDQSAVVPFDLADRQVGTPIAFDEPPRDIAITPDGATAWVAVPIPPHLTPIDLATDTRGTPIRLASQPRFIDLSPDGRTAYVASSSTPELFPVDLANQAVGPPIQLSDIASDLEISPDGRTALVTHSSLDAAATVDLVAGVTSPLITVGDSPQGVTIDRSGQTAYVANNTSAGSLTPIDLTTGRADRAIPAGPFADDVVVIEPPHPPPAVPTPATPTFTG